MFKGEALGRDGMNLLGKAGRELTLKQKVFVRFVRSMAVTASRQAQHRLISLPAWM